MLTVFSTLLLLSGCVSGQAVVPQSTNDAMFTCSDGCQITEAWVSDGFCDCLDCGDEEKFTCDTCPGCPSACGQYVQCKTTMAPSTDEPNPNTVEPHTSHAPFVCFDECEIPDNYRSDGWCDCAQCEDEEVWTCDTCGGCPETCGAYVSCPLICSDGCQISPSYQNDSYCDCSDCGDEELWTCETCGGCPETCDDYVYCALTTQGPFSSEVPHTSLPNDKYLCADGCEISASYLSDGWCDCTQCEDEDAWNCDSCGGCPAACDQFVECSGEPTLEPYSTQPTDDKYVCSDGCLVDLSYANDGYCDCLDCGDESGFTCESCGGCPAACGEYVECGYQTEEPQSTPHPSDNGNYVCLDGCEVNVSYENDGWCDCAQCEDETEWDCDSCGGCPEHCGGYMQCMHVSETTDAPEPSAKPYMVPCADGCQIPELYLDDGYCDCYDCGDENLFTCESCGGCPQMCGGFVKCGEEPQTSDEPFSTNQTEDFMCDDGCMINLSYENDGWCDCGQCEDETEWSCDSCGGCPTHCGGYVECMQYPQSTDEPIGPSTVKPEMYTCSDGCELTMAWVSDGFCDCVDCGDEEVWTCDTCGGCPLTCGEYVECVQGPHSTPQVSTPNPIEPVYTCSDGCQFTTMSWLNDGYCDCLDCGDEEAWDCDSCGGCPETCGAYVQCGLQTEEPQSTDEPVVGPSTLKPDMYTCSDGCQFTVDWVSDGFCDCIDCGDEEVWTCETCGGCPLTCGEYMECTMSTEEPNPNTVEPYTSQQPFVCFDECEIPDNYQSDGWCDCAQCEDEEEWTCDTCGGCPETCGAYVSCEVPTQGPYTSEGPYISTQPTADNYYMCSDGCQISAGYKNDDWCDCVDCGDEEEWTCETCGGCPETCDAYVSCGQGPYTSEVPHTSEGPYTSPPNDKYLCLDGCEISASYLSDGWCDCTQCEDEDAWNCDTCGGCPAACDEFVECSGELTLEPYSTQPNDDNYVCLDGCQINFSYESDGWCDCAQCEDETEWNCDSCGGCPQHCGGYVSCNQLPVTTEKPGIYTCADGCMIPGYFAKDGFCDCFDCGDEDAWTCDSCGGCPAACGYYVKCGGGNPTEIPTEAPVPFYCNDGCEMSWEWVNDDYCDCGECEDEEAWNCQSCGGCPATCNTDDYMKCQAPATFVCDDGCEITGQYVNDDYCDCTECEDEAAHSCAECGGCPETCDADDYVECPVVAEATTEKPDNSGKPETTDPMRAGCVSQSILSVALWLVASLLYNN